MQRPQLSFGSWFGSMWVYTILRFALFFALWGILFLLGVHGMLGAIVALVLSVPLSFVLLAAPRARFAAKVEQRMAERHADRQKLDTELDPDQDERS